MTRNTALFARITIQHKEGGRKDVLPLTKRVTSRTAAVAYVRRLYPFHKVVAFKLVRIAD
jgi:hypothetical protein